MRFSKRPKFQTFQTSDTVIPTFPLNGAKVTKFSLSYTRNGYTWIDLPTVYEAGGEKTQRMFGKWLLLRGGFFKPPPPPPKKKISKSESHWKCGYTISPIIFFGEVWKIMVILTASGVFFA